MLVGMSQAFNLIYMTAIANKINRVKLSIIKQRESFPFRAIQSAAMQRCLAKKLIYICEEQGERRLDELLKLELH